MSKHRAAIFLCQSACCLPLAPSLPCGHHVTEAAQSQHSACWARITFSEKVYTSFKVEAITLPQGEPVFCRVLLGTLRIMIPMGFLLGLSKRWCILNFLRFIMLQAFWSVKRQDVVIYLKYPLYQEFNKYIFVFFPHYWSVSILWLCLHLFSLIRALVSF